MLHGDYEPDQILTDTCLKYEYIYDPNHPLANRTGKVYWHRAIASRKLGRWIETDEDTHHINGIRNDNRSENIEVINRSTHSKIHHPKIIIQKEIMCMVCGKSTFNIKFCSNECRIVGSRKVDRPNRNDLLNDMINISWAAIGRKYGVSDNAVRKWARGLELL